MIALQLGSWTSDLSPIKLKIIATLCPVEVASAVGVVPDSVARTLLRVGSLLRSCSLLGPSSPL